jgi:hypothetical protein
LLRPASDPQTHHKLAPQARTQFDSTNSVSTCAAFSAIPRNRTFRHPNSRFTTWDAYFTFARIRAFSVALSCTASRSASCAIPYTSTRFSAT